MPVEVSSVTSTGEIVSSVASVRDVFPSIAGAGDKRIRLLARALVEISSTLGAGDGRPKFVAGVPVEVSFVAQHGQLDSIRRQSARRHFIL